MRKLIVLLLALNILGMFIVGCSGAKTDNASGDNPKDPANNSLTDPDK